MTRPAPRGSLGRFFVPNQLANLYDRFLRTVLLRGLIVNMSSDSSLGDTMDLPQSDMMSFRLSPSTPTHPNLSSPGPQVHDEFDDLLSPLPGYKLETEIAKGGMGVIHQARDLTINRTVAVKILQDRYPIDSPVAKRFIEEAQITGQLQHPGIPPIYQVGRMADGRPYLAMKLIKGETLEAIMTRWIQQQTAGFPANGGSTSAAEAVPPLGSINYLALIEAVAQAVGYAHAHGVIHRDLKPANIMVGPFGEVQVMDWGLAKLITHDDAPATEPAPAAAAPLATALHDPRACFDAKATQTGTILGTLTYMAPEQAAGEINKIDQRSDVFGLGAVLCYLLTGRPPYSGTEFEAVRLKALRGQTGEAFAWLDASGAEPGVIALCKRCLAFDPLQRPEDGLAVAAEVAALRREAEQRAKQAEIEQARARVFAEEQRKRRKIWFALAIVLLVGVITSSTLALWAFTLESQAKANEQRAQNERDEKERQRETAVKRLSQIERGVEIIANMLAGINPRAEEQGGSPLYEQLRERAEKAVDLLDAESVGDPLVVAKLQTLLGNTLSELGNAAKAVEVLEKARATRERWLGLDHPDTLATMNILAMGYQAAGKLQLAVPLLEEILKRRQTALGDHHPSTLQSMNNLAASYQAVGKLELAVPLLEETLQLSTHYLGEDHLDTLISMNNLATAYQAAGQIDLALPLLEEGLRLRQTIMGADHPATIQGMNNLAACYQAAGKIDQSLPLFEDTLKLMKAKFGANHPNTLSSMNNVAMAYHAAGKLDLALPLGEEALKRSRDRLGPDHPSTLLRMNNLANVYHALGRHAAALALREETLQRRRLKLGPNHPDTLTSMNNLALSFAALNRHDEALALREETLQRRQSKLGLDHPDTLSSMHHLAISYAQVGRHDEALELLEHTLRQRRDKLGPHHPDTLSTMHSLGKSYTDLDRRKEAMAIFEETLQLRRTLLGSDHPDTIAIMHDLASVYADLDQSEKAQGLFAEALQRLEKRSFRHDRAEVLLKKALAFYEKRNLLQQAEDWRRKWLNVVKERSGLHTDDYWREWLGLADNLMKQKKWNETELLLLEGHDWLLKNMDPSDVKQRPYRHIEICQRLAEVYTALNKPDEVKKWRQEQDRWK